MKLKLSAALAAITLFAFAISPAGAATGPKANVVALSNQAIAPAVTEQMLVLPRMLSNSSEWDGQYACTPVVFIGARGSSESTVDTDDSFETNTTKDFSNNTSYVQLGHTLDYIVRSIVATRLPASGPSKFGFRGVGPVAGMQGYGAHSALDDIFGQLAPAVAAGGKAAYSTILQVADTCPTSKLVLLGYSQGATIMRAAASHLFQKDLSFYNSRVIASVFIADPATSASTAISSDSLATALNAATAPTLVDGTLNIQAQSYSCPAGSVAVGLKCLTRDGFVSNFSNGTWANKPTYLPTGWTFSNDLPRSGAACLLRDIICNTSGLAALGQSYSLLSFEGHALYGKVSPEVPAGALDGFIPTLSTWLSANGLDAPNSTPAAAAKVILRSAVTTGKLRVCPYQSLRTSALSANEAFTSRDAADTCHFVVYDRSGALFYELARTKTDLALKAKPDAVSQKKLVSYIGAPSLNWKLLPKNRTKVAYLRITNALGLSQIMKVALPLW